MSLGLGGSWVTGLVIYEDTGVGTSKVALDERSVFFLAGSIPEFQFVLVSIEPAHLGEEVNPDGGLHNLIDYLQILIKLIEGKLLNDAALAYPLIAQEHNFNFLFHAPLCLFFLHFHL